MKPSEKETHTNEKMMLKMFYRQSAFGGLKKIIIYSFISF